MRVQINIHGDKDVSPEVTAPSSSSGAGTGLSQLFGVIEDRFARGARVARSARFGFNSAAAKRGNS